MIRAPRSAVLLATVALAAGLVSCSDGASEGSTGEGTPGGAVGVVAAFYPLQFVVDQVGGEFVSVANLTPAGTEPHDLELTPRDAASLQDAQLVVYLAGFSPAVDEAVASMAGTRAFDVAADARLDLTADAHADEPSGVDPHFWLDPLRLADVADATALRLSELDPDHAAVFAANAAALRDALEALDGEFADGLSACADTNLVTSHEAFGYLAARYGFEQVGITGLTPEDEPSPATLAEIADFVRANSVTTIYYETLVDPAIAETLAAETGATAAVLDPLEGLSDASAGSDYFEVMRSNLANLRTGQRCP